MIIDMAVFGDLASNGSALFAGAICGAVFSIFKLPIPAPPVLSGISGILGVFFGFILVNGLIHHLFG